MPSARSRVLSRELIDFVRDQFQLDWHGIHGAGHWARVRYNGLLLARESGADTRVIELFAFLHDVRRFSDGADPDHGERAAELIDEIAGRLFEVSRVQRSLLELACREHSDGHCRADPTVLTCWDADRLDLGRVGIRPDPGRLCTEGARQPEVIEAAWTRSIATRWWSSRPAR